MQSYLKGYRQRSFVNAFVVAGTDASSGTCHGILTIFVAGHKGQEEAHVAACDHLLKQRRPPGGGLGWRRRSSVGWRAFAPSKVVPKVPCAKSVDIVREGW